MPTPTLLAQVVFTLVLGAVVGLVTYALVFRWLRHRPPLAKVVASLGLLLYLQEVARQRFPPGSGSDVRRPILPERRIEVLGAAVTANRLLLAAGCLVVAAGLTVMLRRTRLGLSILAVDDDETGAVLTGLSPTRIGAAAWALSSTLAGVAVVLIEPIAGLEPTTTSLLVVPALAAALCGGLRSFGVTAVAGLAIGGAQSVILAYVVRADVGWIPSWLPPAGLQQVVPLVLVLVVLVWRGDPLPGRGSVAERRLPRAPAPRHPVVAAVVLGAAALGLLVVGDAPLRQGLIVSLLMVLLALSIVVLTGYVGQVSLAPLAVAGVACFTAIALDLWGAPFPLAVALAAALAGAAGTLLAVPALRIRGMTLAIATLATAVVVEQLVLASPPFGGGPGGRSAPRPWLGPLDVGVQARGAGNFRPAFALTVLVVVVAAGLGVAWLRRSRVGLGWLAVRADERAAAATGIDVPRAKALAFAVASTLAGLAGALTAYATTTVSATSFAVIGAIVALALTYVGGIARIGGAVLAGVLAPSGVLTALGGGPGGAGGGSPDATIGLVLVVAAIAAPDGLIETASAAARRLRTRTPDREGSAPASALAVEAG